MYRQVIVPESKIQNFFETIEKMNKKAEKFGCEKIQILKESELENFEEEIDGFKYVAVVKTFDIELPQIKIGEYEVIGIIKHPLLNFQGAMTTQFYGEEGLSERYKDITPYRCDHCNTNRYRTCQIVLRNKEGKEIVVGKSCVEEYTGLKFKQYTIFSEMNEGDVWEELESFDGRTSSYELKIVIRQMMEIISKYGYIKKSEGDLMLGIVPTFEVFMDKYDCHMVVEDGLVKDFRNYIMNNKYESDFMNNLRSISKLDYVVSSYLPSLACAVNMFMKNRQYQEQNNKRNEERLNSQFIGEENQKVELNVEVRRISYFETMYGRSARVEFSQNGNMIVWFTNVQSFENQNLKENKTYRIKGTVKKHEVFNNTNQTILTRVKVL